MSGLAWLDPMAAPLAGAALRGAVVLLLALLLTTLLRRRSAAARHAIWAGAIAAQLLVLVLALWGPAWRVATPAAVADAIAPFPLLTVADATPSSTPPTRAVTSTTREPDAAIVSPAPAITPAPPVTTPVAAPEPATPARAPASPLLLLWLAGAVVVLLRLAIGTAFVARLARHGARVDDGGWLSLTQRLASSLQLERPLILMRGTRVGVPITWGIVYPVVLLPEDADAWPEERRRFVLVHEMAHVKRLDALTQLVGQLALALFWFNPLVWVANRRMQLEREHACDDYVIRHGTAATTYAEELLQMVRQLGTPERSGAQPAFAALAMARRSEFEGRMLSILDPVLDRHPLHRGRTLMSALAALLIVVPLAALQPYRAATPPRVASATPASSLRVAHRDTITDTLATPVTPVASAAPVAPATARGSGAVGARPSVAIAPAAPVAASVTPHAVAASVGVGVAAAQGATSATSVSGGTARRKYDCDRSPLGTTNVITSIHADDDYAAGRGMIDYFTLNVSRCAQATLIGPATYAQDESDIVDMPASSRTYFRERTRDDDRTLVVTRLNGALEHVYTRNGAPAAWDDEGRRWFADFLPMVLAEAGLNVKPRVARWYSEGGTDRVLRGIATMHSTGGRRTHYTALLERTLSTAEVERAVRQAGRDLAGSSGDMRAVLTQAAPRLRGTSTAATLGDAINAIPSSGDRTAVLRSFGDTDNREVLLTVMRVAHWIPSSGDKAGLMQELAPRYLAGDDRTLRERWFETLRTIPSSGDMRTTLERALPYAARSDEVARAVIEAARDVASSGDRTDVLVGVARANGLRTPALRDAYMRTVREIPSSGDMRRALEAVTRF